MKKLVITILVGLSVLVGSVNASQKTDEGVTSSGIIDNGQLRVYGVGLQIGNPNADTKDKSYNGAGVQFENDFSNIVVEYGSDYTKGSAVLKYDITNDIYIKGGLGYLQREMLILGADKDVTQTTLGAGLGYGDEKSYNIEAGYLDSKLKDAALADGHSKISYIEVVGKHSFGEYATFDIVGIAKNTNVFDKNYDDYQAELGWYATDDVRTFAGYDSVDHDKNDYAVRAGIQYTFATAEFSPYLRATANTDKNVNVGLEYSEDIANRSLKMRDFFENAVGTGDIVAQTVAPEVFASKVVVQEDTPPSPGISSPTIAMANQNVNDEGGGSTQIVGTPTVTNVVAGATYTLTSNPFGVMLTINSSTGQMSWNGDLFGNQTETITVKVTNPDTGTASASFSLTVVDNG